MRFNDPALRACTRGSEAAKIRCTMLRGSFKSLASGRTRLYHEWREPDSTVASLTQ